MVTVIPPVPPPPANPSVAQQIPTLSIPTPSRAFADLPAGTFIEAQFVRVEGAPPQLRTPFGTVEIRPSFPLPANATLLLQVSHLEPQLRLSIITVNGQQVLLSGTAAGQGEMPALPTPSTPAPGQSALGQSAPIQTGEAPRAMPGSAGQTGQPTSQPISERPAVTVTLGSTLSAVLLRPAGTDAMHPASAVITAGSTATGAQTVKPLSANSANARAGQATTTAHQGVQTPAAAGGPGTGGAAPSTLYPEGTHLIVRITPPGNQIGTQASSGAGNAPAVTPATAVAATPSGQTIVQSQHGLVAVDTAQPLPAGERLNLEVVNVNPPAPQATTRLASLVDNAFLNREWPQLNETMDELQTASPATAQQFLDSVVPRPNTQLTANILFFLNALSGGNVRGWLGNVATRLLDAERPAAMNRLSDEFSQLSRIYNEPGGDWRTALVPFYTGSRMEQVRMHTRGSRHGGEEDEEEPKRFLIDIELSRLGRVQLDGLVRARDKRFDLMFRTESPLPTGMRRDINGIFVGFMEAAGVAGTIQFQATGEFVDVPLPDAETISQDKGWTA